MTDTSVVRGAHRYEILVDGKAAGKAYFQVTPEAVVFTHTSVEPEYEGRGLGSALARGALDDVRARGERVVAQCPFIAAFITKHPEYADLLAAG
jgi:predicted GNAT family acetyltransferase